MGTVLPRFAPMLVTSAGLPAHEAAFAFEVKWEGFRGLLYLETDTVRVASRNGFDLTARCPELAALPDALGTPCSTVRLVDEDDLGLGEQRPADHQHLLLAAGEAPTVCRRCSASLGKIT